MDNIILKKSGASFFGFESIDEDGKHHNHPWVVRGCGNLTLTKQGIHYKQYISTKEYFIPFEKITKLDVGEWHNLRIMWPGKVLKIYFKDGDQIKIFGIATGGKLSLTKGFKDDAYEWKEKIEALLSEKNY